MCKSFLHAGNTVGVLGLIHPSVVPHSVYLENINENYFLARTLNEHIIFVLFSSFGKGSV